MAPVKLLFSPPEMIFREDVVIYLRDTTIDICDRITNERSAIHLVPRAIEGIQNIRFTDILVYENTLYAYEEPPLMIVGGEDNPICDRYETEHPVLVFVLQFIPVLVEVQLLLWWAPVRNLGCDSPRRILPLYVSPRCAIFHVIPKIETLEAGQIAALITPAAESTGSKPTGKNRIEIRNLE